MRLILFCNGQYISHKSKTNNMFVAQYFDSPSLWLTAPNTSVPTAELNVAVIFIVLFSKTAGHYIFQQTGGIIAFVGVQFKQARLSPAATNNYFNYELIWSLLVMEKSEIHPPQYSENTSNQSKRY